MFIFTSKPPKHLTVAQALMISVKLSTPWE